MNHTLHIVVFQNPTPANYGGVMDVFYRLKALHQAGVHVILHCFYYDNRDDFSALQHLCQKVYMYPRQVGIKNQISLTPYIVKSRRHPQLLKNLCQDNHPILFDGLHCCNLLHHPDLKHRIKWVRMHNIEHDYYRLLAKNESNWINKLFFSIEAYRLKRFERIVQHAQGIFAVSLADQAYLQQKYPHVPCYHMPCFHVEQDRTEGFSDQPYLLYHGNLSVAENQNVVKYLLKHWQNDFPPLYIAGKSAHAFSSLVRTPNIQLFDQVEEKQLNQLIKHAKANLMLTFQPTGFKLKLINSLLLGGFCIANEQMLSGTTLQNTCLVAQNWEQLTEHITAISNANWGAKEEQTRQEALLPYSNQTHISIILSLLSTLS